ncbi:MAG: hypothetical protein HC842_09370 [Cytophagales bacterium]|nr:hypothetical protein [Cytophagales bacterium]
MAERQFLMKNIGRKEDNTFFWKMNLPVLADQIDNIGESTLPKKYLFTNTLFIKGGNSDFYINVKR